MAKVIGICNQKGGVGKTVSAINISSFMAYFKYKVLLIDMDPQGQSGAGLGIGEEGIEKSSHNILMNPFEKKNGLIIHINPFFDLIPADIDLAATETELLLEKDKQFKLKNFINTVKESYNYIIIDTPPSLGLLTLNTIFASDILIIPLPVSSFAFMSAKKMLEVLEIMHEEYGISNKIYIFLTFYENKIKEAKRLKDKALKDFKGKLLNTIIHKNTKLNEATAKGLPIVEFDKRSRGFRDYKALALEIEKILNRG
ncbi:MAG: hypothetical protein DRG20_04330 [Deltaproteobacteria bacterium]|nr:ParA family protein [Deltaproteobacteria bacterium]RLA89714.1 MAG: hypothetical protein DRG20_04330 [Deltaproteobacteria bacterium]